MKILENGDGAWRPGGSRNKKNPGSLTAGMVRVILTIKDTGSRRVYVPQQVHYQGDDGWSGKRLKYSNYSVPHISETIRQRTSGLLEMMASAPRRSISLMSSGSSAAQTITFMP